MNNEAYDRKELIRYLLHSLPEEDVEAFDELSITNDAFAAALNAADIDLVDGFVRDELDADIARRFEEYYLTTPARRQKVEFARTFREFAERGQPTVPKGSEGQGFFERLRTVLAGHHLRLAFAAAAVLVVTATGWWLIGDRGREIPERVETDSGLPTVNTQTSPSVEILSANRAVEIAQTNANDRPPRNTEVERNRNSERKPSKPIIAAMVLAPALRGSGGVQPLAFSRETTDISARLDLESVDYPSYTVELSDGSGTGRLWRSGTLKARGKTLEIRFPARLLNSGVYTLTVAAPGSEVIATYSFRAIPK